jgi:hypothetical protein
MIDLDAVLEKYIEEFKLYSVEGSTGLRNLCKIARALGYKDPLRQGLMAHDACLGDLHIMLEDNPIIIEAILTCIEDNMNEEWAKNLGVDEEDEEDEHD